MIETIDVLNAAYNRISDSDRYGETTLDYMSFSRCARQIKDRYAWFEMKLNPFGNEGLYIEIFYCADNESDPEYCGCIKTLEEGHAAYRDMGALLGELTYWANKLLPLMYE